MGYGSTIVVALACFALVAGDDIDVKDCGSTEGKVTSVSVSGCSTFPCQFKRGSNETLVLKFTANAASDSIKASVHGVIGGAAVPWPYPSADVCKDTASGVNCPITKGTDYTYTATLDILSSYPQIRVVVKWEMLAADGKDFVCFEFPAEVVS